MNTNSLTQSSNWLAEASRKLDSKGIKSSRLDALIILEIVLGQPRIKLISSNFSISIDDQVKLDELLARRLKDEPIAYIQNFFEFYGRKFHVDKNVLVPRPETETIIDLVKSINFEKPSILDLGSGSGCIGITLKLEMPSAKVSLSDISEDALKISKRNAKDLGADVYFTKTNLLQDINKSFDIIATNLPYVPYEMSKLINLSYEPSSALFSGIDGLDLYKKFWQQLESVETKPKYIVCESLENQHSEMIKLADRSGYTPTLTKDLVQQFSLVSS